MYDRVLALVFAGLVVVAACAHSAPALEEDLALVSRVESRLAADPELRAFELDAATYEGTVVLRGRVEDDHDRHRAEMLTRDTPGTVHVINLIEIVRPPYEVDSPFRDSWLATRVKTRLVATPELDASGLSVNARNGVIVLSGRVGSAADRHGAEVLARRVDGVADVVNEITIAPRS